MFSLPAEIQSSAYLCGSNTCVLLRIAVRDKYIFSFDEATLIKATSPQFHSFFTLIDTFILSAAHKASLNSKTGTHYL